MRIEHTSLKAFSTELTPECTQFIERLKKTGSVQDFVANLDKLTEWSSILGKTEMGRWVDVLNDCDEVLEAASKREGEMGLAIDHHDHMNRAVISVLRFTSLLFENSFSRSIYSSMDHLLHLLDCRNLLIVVQTLRLLLVISKSSRYITQHVQHAEKRLLYMKLTANTESWSGKLRNVKMNDCCIQNFNTVDMSSISFRTNHGVENFAVDLSKSFEASKAELHKRLNYTATEVEESERILAVTKLRLAHNFVDINSRFLCIMSRLISISVLFYSRCLLDEWRINCLINDDLIEQICALLQLNTTPAYNIALDGVKTEAMKTLASIVFLEKPRKIQLVVDCLGLNSYHGLTSSLVRTCVDRLKSGAIEANSEFSVGFVTALFSLVYHIAGFDYGGESLISCSMIGALLGVVKFCSFPDSQISFVTRAVRIIDILTGIDVIEFNTNDGMSAIVDRFSHEVEVCKKQMASTSAQPPAPLVCHQQRVALMKSLLNFLKRAVVDTNYANQVRRIMEGDLPTAIVHIVENPQYYGSSLLHCAIHLTTSFIYQEPAQLTFLQDKGLTDALLQSLFNEKFPVSRDIVTGLPNICSALCLNERGLKAFNERNPLERIFRIIFSTKFVSSLRKRKTEILEAATTLGTAFDELLRHQPTLRKDLMNAFVKILNHILAIGSTEGKKCTISWNIGKAGSAEEDQTRRLENAARDYSKPGQQDALMEPSSDASGSGEMVDSGEQSIFQICYEQDGTTFLPLGDYAGIIGSLLEAVLTNRAAQENSLLILECDIPRKLVKILTFGKPYPAILQSSYLQNLANIIRHLLSQSNKVDAFEVLVSNVSQQLSSYERCRTPEDILSRDRMHLLTRMSSLIFVVSNFMKTSLTNVHDTRSLLLNYFASNQSGQAFINQLFQAYRDLNWDLLYLNSQQTATADVSAPAAAEEDKSGAEPSSSAEVAMDTTEQQLPLAASKTVKKGADSVERSIHSIVSRSHKQIGEVIIYMGKTFCNSITRLRRGFDSSVVKDSHKVAEMLFGGVVQLLKLDVKVSGNWSGIYICHSLSILKKLLFDEYQGHLIMLPFFYKSGCHKAFFELGQFLVENASKEEFSVGVLAWLSIVQRLVCANNILSKGKNELRSQVEGFEAKKYLCVCQNDAIKTLGQFFKAAIATKKESAKEEDCKLLDKIIGAIQVLVRGVVYVHDLEKKQNTEPELEVLIHEIDTDKVQRLVEMGFSQSDAVDALLQHTSVPEAAEYLIAMGEGNSRRSAGFAGQRVASSNRGSEIPMGTEETAPVPNDEGPVVDLQEALESLEPIDAEPMGEIVDCAEASLAPLVDDVAATESTQEASSQNAGEDEQMETDQLTAELQKPCTSTASTLEEVDVAKEPEVFPFADLKDAQSADFKETIDFVCTEIIPDCLELVEKDQMLMFSISELLAVFINEPVAIDWVKEVLVKRLIQDLEKLVSQFSEENNPELSTRFASLLHLFCLLWQNFDNIKVYSLLQSHFYDKIASILFVLIEKQQNLDSKLIPPVLLSIDMYEKERRVDLRQQVFSTSVEHVQWFYWVNDERYGTHSEWRDYPAVCSAVLNKAFREGRCSATVTINEKNVLVDFVEMCQRPLETSVNVSSQPVPVFAKAKLKENFDMGKLYENEKALNQGNEQHQRIIGCLLQLLKSESPLSVALAYSSLSLLLRFVSLKGMIQPFVEAGGIQTLIRLECRENMALINTAITLILRACIDEDKTLGNAFEWIIRSVESGLPVSLAETSRMWPTKSRRYQKEWRRVLRQLAPLAARSSQVYTNVMKANVEAKNNEINLLLPTSDTPKAICSEASVEVLKTIITNLVTELLSTDFSATKHRVLRPAALLKLLAELLKSYSSTASILVDMAHDNRSVVSWMIDKFLLNSSDLPEVVLATKAVFNNLIVCPLATKANEVLINEVKTQLQRTLIAHNKDKSTKLCEKISALARLVLLLRESVKMSNSTRVRDSKQPSSLIRYMHKKNLAVDFAKTIWHLPLNEKAANETINVVLKMFESIARDLTTIINLRAPAAQTVPVTVSTSAAAAPPLQASSQDVTMAEGVAVEESASHPAAGVETALEQQPTSSTSAVFQLPEEDANDSTMVDLIELVSQDATAEFVVSEGIFDQEDEDAEAPHLAAYQQEMLEEDHESHGDEEQSSSSSPSNSEGSDGEGNDLNDDEEETSDAEGNLEQQNMMDGIRRRHRELQRQLDPQVRTSTPISEDELEQEQDDEEAEEMRHERAVIGDPILDETQGEEDEDDDEEMGDEEDEPMEEPDDEDVIEFEDVLSEYLNATDMSERMPNDLRAVTRELGRGIPFPMGGGAFGGMAGHQHHQLQHNHAQLGGNAGNWMNDFDMLATETANANYMAGIFSGGGRIPGGLPMTTGLEGLAERTSHLESEATQQHPMLRRPSNSANSVVSNMLATAAAAANQANGTAGVSAAAWVMGEAGGRESQQNFSEFLQGEGALQRIMIHRLANSRRAQGLRRQGALRRWHPIGGGGGTQAQPNRAAHRFLTRILDDSIMFPGMNMYRPFDEIQQNSQETSAEHRMAEAFVPHFLDRITDQTRMMDAQSVQYINVIVASMLTTELTPPPAVPEPTTSTDTQPQESATTATAQSASEDVNMNAEEQQQPTAENFIQPSAAAATQQTSAVESTAQESPAVDNVDAGGDVNMQEIEAPPVEPSAEGTAQATVDQTPAPIVEPPQTEDPSIPEGVDPAFLAALPEEIRQEVIRDHLRQQRAQRIADAQRLQAQQLASAAIATTTAANPETNTTEGGEVVPPATAADQPAAVETDPEDVLDQEFLAALPPELQEEVLAQHEQRIAQRNRANNLAAAAAEPAAVDVASVFESLPPGLRAQVLADADDSVLQILPPHLLAEANRLRASLEQQQVFRFARMLDRPTGVGRTTNGMNTRTLQQQMPGGASAAGSNEERGVQIFDRESIVTLLMLYFLDHEKFSLMRLQKLLKPLCLHSGTCDYIIWCLVSMLDVLNDNTACEEYTNVSNEGWLDGFQIQTALNQPEKTIRLLPDGVRVHQLVKSNVCLRILDTLVFLARNFPHHFLPNKIRMPSVASKRWDPVPDIKHFWDIVKSVNKKTNAEEHKPAAKALTHLRDIIPASLEQSALAFLLNYSGTPLVKTNAPLMDKSMRILQIVAQSIPSNCEAISEGSMKWLNTCLEELSKLILDNCLEEGLKDGRMFLNEILRTMPSQRPAVFTMLYDTVKDQGVKLQDEIKTLLDELAQLKIKKLALVSENTPDQSAKIATSNELKQKEAADLQLVTLKAFTSRNSQPKKFLKSLETISFLRNQLKLAEKRKRQASVLPPPVAPAVAPAPTTGAVGTETPAGGSSAAVETASTPAAATPVEETTPAVQPTYTPDPTAPSIAEPAGSASVETAALTVEPVVPSTKASTSGQETAQTSGQGLSIIKAVEPTEAELSEEKNLQDMLEGLDPLWKLLSTCLEEMSALLDSHAVLSLQHAAEAFFLAHSFSITQKEGGVVPEVLDTFTQPSTSGTGQSTILPYGGLGTRLDVSKYTQNMFQFADKHRSVLNQILRGNTNNLMEDSAFAILTHFPKLLDFDVKRKYFYKEIRKLDDRSRHEDVPIRIRREHFFLDSFRELFRIKNSDWKGRFYIIFEGEEGQDAGGLLREWYSIITREAFNPGYALFEISPGDRVTYMICKKSDINPDHLLYFKFVGRVIAKAMYDNKQLDCYFTRAFYKHILNVPVRYQDIESEDPSYFKSLEFLLNNPLEDLGTELTFSVEVEEFGARFMRDLKENGSNLLVTDANKEEYVQLVCQMKMTSSIRMQLDAFLEGFYQIIPKKLISIFNEQELELLISGLPEIDIDDLCSNTEYKIYTRSSPQIQWFWRALRSFEQEDLAKFLQFVTGTSKVPLQGFSQLEGMNGVQKFTIHMDSRSSDRLPSAHTCFNQLDLPQYESYEQLKKMLLLAIRECSEGFAFA